MLLNLYLGLICFNKDIVFVWVPAHVGIGETVLLTWQLNVLWRSLSVRDWWFLTLVLRC